MMMRYLGVGIGHMQPPDFPSEIDAINIWLEGEEGELEIPPPAETSIREEPAGQDGQDDTSPLDTQDIESGEDESDGEEGLDDEEEDDYDF
jgi:hypothetical protein